MGTLRPFAKILYESPDGGKTIYGRYEGETERFLVGKNMPKRRDPLDDHDRELWLDIREAALTDKELQEALDRVKVLYYLKQKDRPPMWHPV